MDISTQDHRFSGFWRFILHNRIFSRQTLVKICVCGMNKPWLWMAGGLLVYFKLWCRSEILVPLCIRKLHVFFCFFFFGGGGGGICTLTYPNSFYMFGCPSLVLNPRKYLLPDTLYKQYHTTLSTLIDKHAPLYTPNTPR